MKLFIAVVGSLFCAFWLSAANILPETDFAKWDKIGNCSLQNGQDGDKKFVKITASAKECGIRKREFLLQNASYRLSFFYRTVKGRGHVIVKHGNNTYGLVDKFLPPSSKWEKVEINFTETIPGGHASVWLLSNGECDFADIILELIPDKLKVDKEYSSGMIPPFDKDKWCIYGKGKVDFSQNENIKTVKIVSDGKDCGIRYREVAFQKAAYRLTFSYRAPRGSCHVIVKHGNNTYGLVSQTLPPSTQWQQVEIPFAETIPGSHGSIWFQTRGECEISQVSLKKELTDKERKLAVLKKVPASEKKAAAPLPDLSKKILLMQEYHMWFSSPFADKGGSPGISVWGDTSGRSRYFDPCGPLWRRGDFSLSYPYLGHYDSRNLEIVRWSLQVMKNAGLDGTFCQMYPDCNKNGETFTNLPLFEKYLKVAQEVGYRLGVHDEIQFMPQAAQSVDAFIKRASEALNAAKKYPGAYVRVDGLMVYQFEAWGLRNWTTADFDRMTSSVERNVGEKIHWMVCGPSQTVYPSKDIKMLKAVSDVMVLGRSEPRKINYGTGGNQKWSADKILSFDDPLLWRRWANELKRNKDEIEKTTSGKEFTVWVYPGFTNTACVTAHTTVLPDSSFDRGEYLINNIRTVLDVVDPRIILLSSWNERREKTNFEPTLGGENADPFYLIKLLAQMKRVKFTAPPLPPKEYVDPWRWSELYGIDRTPPAVAGLRVIPTEARIEADVTDDLSGIKKVDLSAAPLCFFDLSDEPGEFGGVCTGEVSKIKNNAAAVLRIIPDKAIKGNAFLAIKSRIPVGYELICTLTYPKTIPYYQYLLNLRRVTTIPLGPIFFGDGKLRYRTIPLIGMDESKRSVITVSMKLRPCRSTTADANAFAEVKAAVIYPERICNESERGFFLPSADKKQKNAVLEIPAKLLPRNFFDLPMALQVEDNNGNYSAPVIFDIRAGEENDYRSMIPKTVDVW